MLSIYPSLETSGLSMLAGDIEHMSNKNGGFIDCCCFLEGSTLQNCIKISPESSVKSVKLDQATEFLCRFQLILLSHSNKVLHRQQYQNHGNLW